MGEIVFYNRDKGFGFIKVEEGQIFFHITDVLMKDEEIQVNSPVRFKTVEYKKNGKITKKAVDVELVEGYTSMYNPFYD